jgi:hypothetical protein
MDRLRAGASQARTIDKVPEWLEKNTMLNGRPYSFSGHRYQIGILSSQAQNLVCIKPSQIGMSEIIARMILAKASILKPYNVIYCMPSAKAAQDFCKTRVSPVIDESPYLQALIDKNNDSVNMKRIGYSNVYFRGAFKDSQSISTPADAVIADEYAYCDETIVKQFNSRLTHSEYKNLIYFSTPLLPNHTISKEYAESKRHVRMYKCVHCGSWHWPSFLDHCVIPGHDVDWLTVTKPQLMELPWQETVILCPTCGKIPDLSWEHREWVCENPDSRFNSDGFRCSPFDVPSRIKPAYLAEKSVAYARKIDWMNVNLGLEAEDKESSLFRSEVEACLITEIPGRGVRVMGVDVGMESHIVVLEVGMQTDIIVHTEVVPAAQLVERYFQIRSEYRVAYSVIDAMPFTETVIAMQRKDPNLLASFYSTAKSAEPFKVQMRDEDRDKAQTELRKVTTYRDVVFDIMMLDIRTKSLLKVRDANDTTWVDHMLSMKRIKQFMDDGNIRYVWTKTDGVDHFSHATVFAKVAKYCVGAARGINVALPLVSSFKVQQAS